jgi:hypothetical protein
MSDGTVFPEIGYATLGDARIAYQAVGMVHSTWC